MVTQADLVDCLSLAVAAFPQYPLTQAQVVAYYELLKDLDISKEDLYSAIKESIQTSRFFPTVADIRERAIKKVSNQPPQFNHLELENPKAVPMPEHLRETLGWLYIDKEKGSNALLEENNGEVAPNS